MRSPVSKSSCKMILSPHNCVYLSIMFNMCCSLGGEKKHCGLSQRSCINQSGVIHITKNDQPH